MLHALSAEPSSRQVWWFHAARSGAEHPFAAEAQRLIRALPHSRSYVQYSQPRPEDKSAEHYDAAGHLEVPQFARLGVALESDFYLCGPPAFLRAFKAGLANWGVASRPPVYRNIRPRRILRARPDPGLASLSACACRVGGAWTASVFRSKRDRGSLGSGAEKPARIGRGLRCGRPMVLSKRSLPQLRNRADRWRYQLRSPARRIARCGQSLNLLFLSSW